MNERIPASRVRGSRRDGFTPVDSVDSRARAARIRIVRTCRRLSMSRSRKCCFHPIVEGFALMSGSVFVGLYDGDHGFSLIDRPSRQLQCDDLHFRAVAITRHAPQLVPLLAVGSAARLRRIECDEQEVPEASGIIFIRRSTI